MGFEATQFALVELESTPLDHSGKVSTAGMTKNCGPNIWDWFFPSNPAKQSKPLHQPAVAPTKWKPERCRQKGWRRTSKDKKEKEAAEKMDHQQRRRKQTRRGGLASVGQPCWRHKGPACQSPAGWKWSCGPIVRAIRKAAVQVTHPLAGAHGLMDKAPPP